MYSRVLTALSVVLLVPILGLSCASNSYGTVPEAKSDKGLVVFYRPARSKGAAIRFEVRSSDGQSVGALSNGSMLHKYLDPGQMTFEARAPSVDGKDSITLDIVAGETYYVMGEILWGWPAGRPKFSRKSASEARAELEESRSQFGRARVRTLFPVLLAPSRIVRGLIRCRHNSYEHRGRGRPRISEEHTRTRSR